MTLFILYAFYSIYCKSNMAKVAMMIH